jgi:hypothetical protein
VGAAGRLGFGGAAPKAVEAPGLTAAGNDDFGHRTAGA